MKIIYYVLFFILFSCSYDNSEVKSEQEIGDSVNIVSQSSIEKFNVDSLKELANRFYEKDSLIKALKLYEILAENDSGNALYFYRMGYCYNEIKMPDVSLKSYYKSLKLNYENKPEVFFSISCVEANLGGYEKSLFYISEAIKLKPKETKYYAHRGMINLILHKVENACKDFKISISSGDTTGASEAVLSIA